METGFERLNRRRRRWTDIVAVVVTSWAAAGGASAEPAKVVVPLACAVERGRLVVNPASERTHPILGQRSSHAFTTCAAGKEPRCRSFMVHEFDLSCDGYRVSWLGLVGGALERDDPRIRVVGNRFTLRMPPGWNAGRSTSANEPDIVAFPAGFAPALNLPARFIGDTVTVPTVTTWEEPGTSKPSANPVRVASMAPVAFGPSTAAAGRTPIMTASTTVEATAPATEASSWMTTVEPVSMAFGTSRERLGTLAAAVAFAWLVLFAARRRFVASRANALGSGLRALPSPSAGHPAEPEAEAPQPPPHPQPDNDTAPRASSNDGDTYAAHCARMISDAVTQHKAIRDAVQSMTNSSLRDVLNEDLEMVQAVLLAPNLANDIASGLWTSVEIAVTRVLADLDRIGRIIEGLSKTAVPDAVRYATTLPETADDAFHLLGVRSDASPVAVKKIVDGLRLSWHPDHAKDETDRSIREARLKQVNVAWDLIQGHQKAA